jgi:hypothetical protein
MRLNGKRLGIRRLTRNVRAKRAYRDPSLTRSGEAAPAQRYRKMF